MKKDCGLMCSIKLREEWKNEGVTLGNVRAELKIDMLHKLH